jgi:hypothetical protein
LTIASFSPVLTRSRYTEHPPPKYVIFLEINLTSENFMREITAIEPAWLSELAPHYYKVILCAFLVESQSSDSSRPSLLLEHLESAMMMTKRTASQSSLKNGPNGSDAPHLPLDCSSIPS